MRRLALLLSTLVLVGTPLGRYLPGLGTKVAHAQVWEDEDNDDELQPPDLAPYDQGAPDQPLGGPMMEPSYGGYGPPQEFFRSLAPYGRWIDTPDYGWVWQPDPAIVGTDFRPYASGGQWVATPDGWAFESEYPFGWAVFHYGRWFFDPDYGWLWVPGAQWAPAWVDWRYGDGYVGWVPLPPPGFVFSMGVAVYPGWCFVPVQSFTAPNVYVHVVPVTAVRRVYPVTRPLNNPVVVNGYRWNRGPQTTIVEHGGAHVTVRPSLRSQTSIEAHVPNAYRPLPRTGTVSPGTVNRPPTYQPPAELNRPPVTAPPPTISHPASPAPVVPHTAPPTMGRPAPHVTPMPAPHVAPAPAPHIVAPAPHMVVPHSMGHISGAHTGRRVR